MDDLGLLGDLTVPGPPLLSKSGALEEATQEADEAAARLDAGHAALAAAEDVLAAAQAKPGEGLSGWQRAAAAESLTQAERARDRAAADVETLAGKAEQARRRLETVQAEVPTTPARAAGVELLDEEPQLYFGSAEEFLHEQLLPLYNRIVDGKNGKWCRQWYLHPEAVSRVEALWRAWEHFRLDAATGMSVWWRDHADPHMGVLLNPKGPFHACTATTHYTPDSIACELAPKGWFPDERAGQVNCRGDNRGMEIGIRRSLHAS